jgi:hypothetical protein
MALVMLLSRLGLSALGVGTAGRFVSLVILGTAGFVVGCLWRAPSIVDEVVRWRRRRRRSVQVSVTPTPAEQ